MELSATDRIKELEALVRKLQSQNTAPGSPNHGGPRDAQAKGNTARIGSLPDGSISQNGTDSMMLKEDGQGEAVYVESCVTFFPNDTITTLTNKSVGFHGITGMAQLYKKARAKSQLYLHRVWDPAHSRASSVAMRASIFPKAIHFSR